MQKFIDIRHQLHAHPELSGQEAWTAAFVVNQLRTMGVMEVYTGFAQHDVLAVIRGKKAGKTILFRSELDALPIVEQNAFSYRSTQRGVAHKCGHDGHTATLLAVAQHFMYHPLEKGSILLIFQSAEETGTGARAVIDSNILNKFYIDFAFAYHNLPGLPLGVTFCKTGIFSLCIESFNLKLKGISCHSSEPAKGINPADTLAKLIQWMSSLHQPDKTLKKFCIATPIHIQMGEKSYGISAGYAEVGFTIRTQKQSDLEDYKSQIVKKIEALCSKAGLSFEIEWLEAFCANNNDVFAVEQIQQACLMQGYAYENLAHPFNFGEDFGLFTDIYKGAMFAIGAGENCPALHTVDYDFPDELIEIGANIFKQIALQLLI